MSSLRRRVAIIGTILVVVVLLCGAAIAARDRLEGDPAPAGTPVPASTALTADETAFYQYVSPRLRAINAEMATLVQLGRSRSRNVVELGKRGDRVDQIAGQIEQFLSTTTIPSSFSAAIDRYREGIAIVQTAEDDARTALSSFNFKALGAAVDELDRGRVVLDDALRQLESAAGFDPNRSGTAGATPSPTRS